MENSTCNNTATLIPGYVGSVLWIVIYCVVICATFVGNILTIFAITISKQLSSLISNQFIFSLALSDLLVGISVPYHMCFYLIDCFGQSKYTCLIRFVFIVFACASSIHNIFFIATDRYIAIIYPFRYNRYMTRKVAVILTSTGWILSFSLSTVPLYWNLWHEGIDCETDFVLPANYFNVILTPMFAIVWVTMIVVYIKIWMEAAEHAKRIRSNTNLQNSSVINDTKSIQVVMLTLGCFSICWMPYFIVITYFRINGIANRSILYEVTFTMAVTNSGMNPIIYAWKNSNFRVALWCLLRCQSPNSNTKKNNYITNHVPSKNCQNEAYTNGKHNDLTRNEHNMGITNENNEDTDKESSVNTEMTNINTNYISRTDITNV